MVATTTPPQDTAIAIEATKARSKPKTGGRPPWMEKPPMFVTALKALTLAFIVVVMLFPFINVFAVSFSTYEDILGGGLVLFPKNPTLDAYRAIFSGGIVVRALQVSAGLTIFGTLAQMIFTTTMAYGLSRPNVPGSRGVLFVVLGAMLISPGIIPSFLLIKEFNLLDTYAALIVPGLISSFNLIIVRQFFINLPQDLIDSARLDGASEWAIFRTIVLPLSKAVLAVVSLFYAVGIWNSFFNAILYISDTSKWPIQLVLRQYVLQGASISAADFNQSTPLPPQTLQMAIVVIATVPILVVYPFLQKYFTRGVLTGAIKG
ncbi:MAG TPA: carbohydrate ABC transporter permease [Thermomicrobiales bacterium]|nr:carbohydrate ABC transporter permease [Thermomicrobiales bacterium]